MVIAVAVRSSQSWSLPSELIAMRPVADGAGVGIVGLGDAATWAVTTAIERDPIKKRTSVISRDRFVFFLLVLDGREPFFGEMFAAIFIFLVLVRKALYGTPSPLRYLRRKSGIT